MSALREALRLLRNEIDCRIDHGAKSGGHLEYVIEKIDGLMLANPEEKFCCEQMANECAKWQRIENGGCIEEELETPPANFCPYCGKRQEATE